MSSDDLTLSISRRATLRLAGGVVAYFGIWNRAAFAVTDSGSGRDGARQTDFDRDSARRLDERQRMKDEYQLVLLRSEFASAQPGGDRAPRCEIGTKISGPLEAAVVAGRSAGFGAEIPYTKPESANEKLAGRGNGALDAGELKRLLAKLPDDVKVSVGVQWGIGRMGLTPVFVNPMADYSNKAYGYSLTIGAGGSAGGFVNFATFDGKFEASVGFFGATPAGHALQCSINVTDLIKGTLTLTDAVAAPMMGPIMGVPNYGGVQVSVDVRPIDVMVDVVERVILPITDYRTFQGPFSQF